MVTTESLQATTNFLIIGSIAVLVASLTNENLNSRPDFTIFLYPGLMIIIFGVFYYMVSSVRDKEGYKENCLIEVLYKMVHYLLFLAIFTMAGISFWILLPQIQKNKWYLIIGIVLCLAYAIYGYCKNNNSNNLSKRKIREEIKKIRKSLTKIENLIKKLK